ncbi:MAG: N-acetyl-gamma-glutamyl-phosphate reductase [Clostridia bacterium]|nr:N-acetyl-gamma-glutamyl-phosphate reductase [Clostridia bacterium]
MVNVFIDGREGTTGLRIFERFSKREDLRVIALPEELRKDPTARKEAINAADVAFLCLPDAAARESVSLVENDRVIVIDASTAHRTLPDWDYGFPELSAAHREALSKSNRIAVPGCHAGGFVSLAYPLVTGGLLSPEAPLSCFSITGYSGGGKKMIAEYEADERRAEIDSPRQYGLGQQHKHLPEMQKIPGLVRPPVFCPIVSDYACGMVVSLPLPAELLTRRIGVEGVHELFAKHYADQKMVKVLPAYTDPMLGSNNLTGYDHMEIAVHGNDDRMVVTARFDNLGKGASGAAVQCMNIALGLDETTGLNVGE